MQSTSTCFWTEIKNESNKNGDAKLFTDRIRIRNRVIAFLAKLFISRPNKMEQRADNLAKKTYLFRERLTFFIRSLLARFHMLLLLLLHSPCIYTIFFFITHSKFFSQLKLIPKFIFHNLPLVLLAVIVACDLFTCDHVSTTAWLLLLLWSTSPPPPPLSSSSSSSSSWLLLLLLIGTKFSSFGHQESTSHFDYVHWSMQSHSVVEELREKKKLCMSLSHLISAASLWWRRRYLHSPFW